MGVTPFTFGIPLIARAAARDWVLVQGLLDVTLQSLAAQTDRRFRIIVAGHDEPESGTAPFDFVRADWPAESVRPDNLDSGRKKALIAAHAGAGHLMFVDADDWVDTRLVATVRAKVVPGTLDPAGAPIIGGVVGRGYAIDLRNRRALTVPHAEAFAGGFHELCGSSTVALVDPEAATKVGRDPYAVLHEHYRWDDTCRAHGVASVRLDLAGGYVVNTGANHSTTHGPFAAWRRGFDAAGAGNGCALDEVLLARFGLDGDAIRGVAALLAAR